MGTGTMNMKEKKEYTFLFIYFRNTFPVYLCIWPSSM